MVLVCTDNLLGPRSSWGQSLLLLFLKLDEVTGCGLLRCHGLPEGCVEGLGKGKVCYVGRRGGVLVWT